MGDSELGVNFYCWGEYRCKICHRFWESSKAWKLFGQKCKSCNVFANSENLQELYYYHCTKCKKVWKYKKTEEIHCNFCGLAVKPISRVSLGRYYLPYYLKTEARFEDNRIPHEEALCEKCKIYGKYCKYVLPGDKPVKKLVKKKHQQKYYGENLKTPKVFVNYSPLATENIWEKRKQDRETEKEREKEKNLKFSQTMGNTDYTKYEAQNWSYYQPKFHKNETNFASSCSSISSTNTIPTTCLGSGVSNNVNEVKRNVNSNRNEYYFRNRIEQNEKENAQKMLFFVVVFVALCIFLKFFDLKN